jgi:acyl dehydratase
MSATEPEVWTGPFHEFAFPIERGHVLAFRRAIGADDTSLDVPPTFAVVADHFDPQFARRPPLGRGWNDGVPPSHLHVEQSFTYTRPLRIGETLTVRRGQGRVWTREGRTAGPLRFVEERTELLDPSGEIVVVVSWVDVHAEQSHADLTNRQAAAPSPQRSGPRSGPADGGSAGQNADEGVVVVEDITRTQIVMYVGASGDYHPLHHDDDLAARLGYPSVFVPGMLTMGLTGKAVTDLIDLADLRSFGGRFRSQVWPGSTLVVTTSVSPTDDGVDVAVTTRTNAGTVVFEGTAQGSTA